jgi:hypothetical protein
VLRSQDSSRTAAEGSASLDLGGSSGVTVFRFKLPIVAVLALGMEPRAALTQALFAKNES